MRRVSRPSSTNTRQRFDSRVNSFHYSKVIPLPSNAADGLTEAVGDHYAEWHHMSRTYEWLAMWSALSICPEGIKLIS